jgi:hypothetical protein
VWHPGQLQQNGPGHGGVCNLLRPTEVAGLLDAAVVDPEGIGARNSNTGEALEGCRYTSRLNGTDRVEIHLGSGTHFAKTYAQAKQVARQQVAVPTVGLDTYATITWPASVRPTNNRPNGRSGGRVGRNHRIQRARSCRP